MSDDQFNDGVFLRTMNTSNVVRPNVWPKSVSEMRKHTSYTSQNLNAHDGHDTGISNYKVKTPVGKAPTGR